jgi:YD repeat-containing protein
MMSLYSWRCAPQRSARGGWAMWGRALLIALMSVPSVFAATNTYTYDELGRLINVTESVKGAAVTYGYDAAGNRTQTKFKSESIKPSVPAGLSATAVSGTQINLSWSPSTDTGGSGLAGYKIYRGGSEIGTRTTTSFSDSSLTSSTTYSYTVAAYDADENVSAQSSSASATTLERLRRHLPPG